MITEQQVKEVAARVEAAALGEALIGDLRQAYPDVHFTYCMDDDINVPSPVFEGQGFNIYLVDGREHCLCLTKDYEVASGMVLAEVVDDED